MDTNVNDHLYEHRADKTDKLRLETKLDRRTTAKDADTA